MALFEEELINASYTDGQQSHDRTKSLGIMPTWDPRAPLKKNN
jgi:hypothetical protein